MDKGPTVPKWVLINRPKIPKMPENLSAQIVWDFDEKRLHWASVVRAFNDSFYLYFFLIIGNGFDCRSRGHVYRLGNRRQL